MKNKVQLLAEGNAANSQLEAQYTEVSSVAVYALRKGLALRAAVLALESKIQVAAVEFEEELKVIEENHK